MALDGFPQITRAIHFGLVSLWPSREPKSSAARFDDRDGAQDEVLRCLAVLDRLSSPVDSGEFGIVLKL
jgi:hypothetical protein